MLIKYKDIINYESYFIYIHCMYNELTPISIFFNIYIIQNLIINIAITLIQYYSNVGLLQCISASIPPKPNIAYILYCNIAINIFKTDIFTLLQCC